MSHEVEFVPPQPGEGFDRDEPKVGLIGVFTVISLVALILVIFGMQAFYEHIREQQIYEKVLAPVGEDLTNLRAREDAQLKSYGYIDKAKGQVRLPIDRAMQLLTKEYAEGKVSYSTKPTVVKPPEPPAGVAPAPGAPGTPAPNPPNAVGKAK